MLYQIALADTLVSNIRKKKADNVELVVAGPYLRSVLAARLRVLRLNHLRVVLKDVRESLTCEHLLPQVVGLEPIRVRRIPRAVVEPPIERQEPRRLALQLGAEADLLVIHREVCDAATELEEAFAGVTVALVLLNRIGNGLLGQVVLQLEGRDWEAVDEQRHVQGQLRFISAVFQLARHAESVAGKPLGRLLIPWGRGSIEQVDVEGAMLDPMTQNVDNAALRNLALETGQELPTGRGVFVERQGLDKRFLCCPDEPSELHEIDGVFTVILRCDRPAAIPTPSLQASHSRLSAAWARARRFDQSSM